MQRCASSTGRVGQSEGHQDRAWRRRRGPARNVGALVRPVVATSGSSAFLLAVGMVVAGMSWHAERKRRQAAEDFVRQMIPRVNPEALSLAMAPPVSHERIQGFLVPEQRKQLR